MGFYFQQLNEPLDTMLPGGADSPGHYEQFLGAGVLCEQPRFPSSCHLWKTVCF